MPTVQDLPSIPKPQSLAKDDVSAPKRASPEPLRTLQPTNSHPVSPKARDRSPEPAIKPEPVSETVRAPSIPPADEEDEASSSDAVINFEIFSQILDLDEDGDDHEFSWSMVQDYFVQAEETFEKMSLACTQKDLKQLSDLGHFLKGSSASFGLVKVQATCETIQYAGNQRDEEAKVDLSEAEALQKIYKLLKQVKVEYIEAHAWLTNFFESGAQ